jgi:hypothetical protein
MLVPPSLVSEIEREGLPYRVGGEPPRAVIDETWQRVRATGCAPILLFGSPVSTGRPSSQLRPGSCRRR